LSESEIAQLATETRATGRHVARLNVNAGGEVGETATLLRAEVAASPHVVTLDTEPSGLPLVVDGVTYATPVAFSVQDDTTAATHWGIGSLHVVQAPGSTVVTSDGGEETTYAFQSWNVAGGLAVTVAATRDLENLTASYLVSGLSAGSGTALPMGTPPPPPLAGGYPTGPFIRLSDASLSVPFLDGFTVEGDMYLSATQFNATLSTTSIDIPDAAADNLLHVGPGEWTIDFMKNSHFQLESRTPAVRILGSQMTPQTLLNFNLNPVDGSWNGSFSIPDGFKLLPEVMEFGPSTINVAYQGYHTLSLNGTMRLLRLPDQSWAAEDSVSLQVNDGPFQFDLTPYLPTTLVSFNGLAATKGTTTLSRDATGVFKLGITNSSISMFAQPVGIASGSVSTDGALDLVSTTFSAGVPVGPFSLQKKSTGDSFRVKLRSKLPNPSLRFSLPRLLVKSSSVYGWPSGGVEMPGFEFNVDGVFDTGKVSLPTFSFDSIGISRPTDGPPSRNYVRLKRESNGNTLFVIQSEVPFPFPPPLDCSTHKLRFEIANGVVSGTYSGKFCLPLDQPVSLEYNSGGSCQFQATAGIYNFYFGSTCHGVCSGGVPIFGVCP